MIFRKTRTGRVILYCFLLGILVSGAMGHWQVAQGFIIAIAVSVVPGMNWIYVLKGQERSPDD